MRKHEEELLRPRTYLLAYGLCKGYGLRDHSREGQGMRGKEGWQDVITSRLHSSKSASLNSR